MNIDIYEDYVELHMIAEGSRKHEKKLDMRTERTSEQKIITILDVWKGAYW